MRMILKEDHLLSGKVSHFPKPSAMLERKVVLIQKNGDYEVEASFTENEVTSSNVTGLTYCKVTSNRNSSQIIDKSDSEEHSVKELAVARIRLTTRG